MADKNFLTDIIDADLAEGKISEIHTDRKSTRLNSSHRT